MIEGWHGSDHLILFDEAEIAAASDRYAVSQFLPGYEVIGLRWWDDFILQDFGGATFCAPTIPAVADHVSAYALPSKGTTLKLDDRFQGKIKWYVKPIVFGGDPQSQEKSSGSVTISMHNWSNGQILERFVPLFEESMSAMAILRQSPAVHFFTSLRQSLS